MRLWIENLITNQGVYKDFQDYMVEIEKRLNRDLSGLILSGKTEKAIAIAAELKAYQTIKKSVDASLRERQSQITYQENNQ